MAAQLEHTLRNVFQPFGKLLRISWAVIFFIMSKPFWKKTCVFLQMNIEVAIELVCYYHAEINFMASTGNIPHIFSARPPFNHKSSFLLNYLVTSGRYGEIGLARDAVNIISQN